MEINTFSFGKNWQKFLKLFNNERAKAAEKSLTEFLGTSDLTGKSFIDIGCGSGLFSLAAYKLGASKVISFDVDPFSVHCCLYLHEQAQKPENWTIQQQSVLDADFLSRLPKFDIVYSWGVLHHTGNMWQAIKNSAGLVNRGGYYYIAIYNRYNKFPSSGFWLGVKRLYNSLPRFGQWLMELAYIGTFYLYKFLHFRNPWKDIKNYKPGRGMDWRTDMIDWIGGYPYEYASADEIENFIKKYFPNFELLNVRTVDGWGCNWFVFKNKEPEHTHA